MKETVSASLFCLAVSGSLFGQSTCGSRLTGAVRDSTGAVLPDAAVSVDGNLFPSSGGTFNIPCLTTGVHQLMVTADGFATKQLTVTLPANSAVAVTLIPKTVETTIEVDGNRASSTGNPGEKTLTSPQVQGLAEDPDELLRQLQQMAATGGAAPGNITISVDGFQDSSTLPAKADIASITIDPDLYSAEYSQPPYNGGRVEVQTKPGQKALHGSLFAVNGSPFEDAKDPFSLSKAAVGKQRYGGTLTGPMIRGKSDFRVGLEARSISEYAVTVGPTGLFQPTTQSVETPQKLWLPSGGVKMQTCSNNFLNIGYTGSLNNLKNVGVGGLNLGETGYASEVFDHVLRFSDVLTLRGSFVNDARLSFRFTGENDSPLSTAPQVQVAGAFVAGGSALGAEQIHEFKTEFNDSLLFSFRQHTIKTGVQMLLGDERRSLTTNFNGVYTFGGGTAPTLNSSGGVVPGSNEPISGIEQYRRTIVGLPGGVPTSFSVVTGSPDVRFVQDTAALFVQDDWTAFKSLRVAMGLRYFTQTSPTILGTITPRVGFNWMLDPKGDWAVHAHAGLFASGLSASGYAEIRRLDGFQRISSLVYNPIYGRPLFKAKAVTTRNTLATNFSSTGYTDENVGATAPLPFGWQVESDVSFGRIRNGIRSVNINSPFDNNPYGARPSLVNANVMETQDSGEGRIDIELLSFSQPHWKKINVSFGAVRIHQADDLSTPQNSRSNLGEFARSAGQPVWQTFDSLDTTLPSAIHLNTDFYASGGLPYNVTTGMDNNGDGVFNDRPIFTTDSQVGALRTPWGYVLNSGTGVSLPRNRGTLPPNIHLDASLERAFSLEQGAESKRNITASLRSSNLLNHTNVTGVGNIPGSPLFGQPYAASSARRIEAGLRYSF